MRIWRKNDVLNRMLIHLCKMARLIQTPALFGDVSLSKQKCFFLLLFFFIFSFWPFWHLVFMGKLTICIYRIYGTRSIHLSQLDAIWADNKIIIHCQFDDFFFVVLVFSLFETTQTLFWAVFGLVDLDSFELDGIKIFTRFWGMLMFGTYSVINIVVLLNLLIAMMNHSYQLISVSRLHLIDSKFCGIIVYLRWGYVYVTISLF